MSEQKTKPTAEEKIHEEKISLPHSKLLFFILIIVFFLATCVCVIFLIRAIKNEAGNAIVGLWTAAVSLSFLAAIVPAILLLTKKFKEKWISDIKADSELYVSNMRSAIKKANATSICPEEPPAFESEVMTDSNLILQKKFDRSEMEGEFSAISDGSICVKAAGPSVGIIVTPRKKAQSQSNSQRFESRCVAGSYAE